MDIWEVKKNYKGFYQISNKDKVYTCQVGLNGFIKARDKIEGDKSTPEGKWLLKKT